MKRNFANLISQYGLENEHTNPCPACGEELTIYSSIYVDGIFVELCRCGFENEYLVLPKIHENLCELCDEIVKFNEQGFVSCDTCERKAHVECASGSICDECHTYACDLHRVKYTSCDKCGKIHDEDCFPATGREFVDSFGLVCSACFFREKESLKALRVPPRIIKSLAQNSNHYVREARENFDLTVNLTHLIKSSEALELLKKILRDGRLVASTTGYYSHEKTVAVCFTDLSIRGLNRHAKAYSPYGIAFYKETIFEQGGGPALYIPENILKGIAQPIPMALKPFINKINLATFDFHHEREWRIPKDFVFSISEISVVYAPTKHHDELRAEFPEILTIMDLDLLSYI